MNDQFCVPANEECVKRLRRDNLVFNTDQDKRGSQLMGFFDRNELCDFTLISKDGLTKVNVHRILLFARIPYIYEICGNELTSFRTSMFDDMLNKIARFLYTDKIEVDVDNIIDLLKIAQQYRISDLEKFCYENITREMSAKRSFDILLHFENEANDVLEKLSINYICENFLTVCNDSQFYGLSTTNFVKILQNEHLTVEPEEIIFELFLKWHLRNKNFNIKDDRTWTSPGANSKRHISNVLDNIRFPLMDSNFFSMHVEQFCKKCERHDLVLEYYKWQTMKNCSSEVQRELKNKRMEPRKPSTCVAMVDEQLEPEIKNEQMGPREPPTCVAMVDEQMEPETKNELMEPCKPSISIADKQTEPHVASPSTCLIVIGKVKGHFSMEVTRSIGVDNWIKLKKFDFFHFDHHQFSSCTLIANEKLIFTGGSMSGDASKEVYCLNLKTATVERFPRMNHNRHNHGSAELNGYIYVAGGDCKSFIRNSVEKLNVEKEEWSLVGNMKTARTHFGFIAAKSYLFAIGGRKQSKVLNAVEYYDPALNMWFESTPMIEVRASPGVALLNNFIYTIGGTQSINGILTHNETMTVERFNLATKEWMKVASLISARYHIAACICQNKLFAIGAYDGEWKKLGIVEAYDSCEDRWNIVSTMNVPKTNAFAIEVKDLYETLEPHRKSRM